MTVVEVLRGLSRRHFGDEGRAWLATVPGTLSELAEEWQLGLGARLRGGLLAIVHEATTSSEEQVVLKLASRWDRPLEEITCLGAWAGGAHRGCSARTRRAAQCCSSGSSRRSARSKRG